MIGEPLDVKKLSPMFAKLTKETNATWKQAAEAIITTDTFPKGATATCKVDDVTITICGIAKGSGMIAPNMATMLGYISTRH